MDDRSRKQKRPRDANQLAKSIVDIATGQVSEDDRDVEAQRRGGRIGGQARAKKLTPDERSEIARAAAAARWKKRR